MVGTHVSHFRITDHIGAGGMGTVYLAEDLTLKRRVALKFLSPDRLDAQAAARLLREARSASSLDHPHIATIYEIDTHAGQPFIAMAYYEGENLAARLARGPMANDDVARILMQAADAIEAAHAAGIVHRDLKPSNVLITTAGQAKVLDFGIAKTETSDTATQLTAVGETVGTTAYMSPEQAAGEAVDARSDVWSLGVLTYEMLTGRPAFQGANALATLRAVMASALVPLTTLRPDAAPELQEIVNRTLVRDRERRTITAGAVRDLAAACHTRLSSGTSPAPVRPRISPRLWIGVAIVALTIAGGAVVWLAERNAKVRWARHEALPEIMRLSGDDKFDDAYRLAQQAQPYIPDDPLLAEQWRQITRTATIESDPAGAEVYYRPYHDTNGAWRRVGRTPVTGAIVPRGSHHWKAELPGHETAHDVAPGPFGSVIRLRFSLVPPASVPPGMVRITSPQRAFSSSMPGLEHLPPVELSDFWIDRYEVTNRAFKQFVDDGAYRRPELWQEPFVRDGRRLTFAAAVDAFRDATGRPGPAGWELGNYITGQADYPVTGISWYEASAYARWAGKSLPTLHHWGRAAGFNLSGDVVPISNFLGKSLLPVGATHGTTRAGTSDMAGNAKEWILNAAGEKRYILGGGFDEPVYMFIDPDAQLPWRRSRTYGFRCIKVDRAEDLTAELTAEIRPSSRDPRKATPVGDSVFNAWRALYAFDHGDLKVQVEKTDNTAPDWRVEKVSYAAAYGDERITAYLFLPKNAAPPYQVMVGFSGGNVFFERSSDTSTDFDRFSFLMRSGRAFLYPVYKSTFERADSVKSDTPTMSAAYRDHLVMWSKDVGRSVDYLQSRSDIDKDKIGFIGLSSGASLAPVFLAVEPRLKLGVIYMGGLYLQPSLPEADTVNFAPRVKVPVLMLNGKFDYYYPTTTSQEPLFKLLGTRRADKHYVVYDASHNIPRNQMMKEVVNWMEKYWGAPMPLR